MRARQVPFVSFAHCVLIALPAASVVLFAPTEASAHIQLEEPSARTSDQKIGPCGGVDKPAAPAHVFSPGETIAVTFVETVPHPGHFRVALDLDGEDDFVYPTGPADTWSNDTVLLDEIPDVNLESVTVEVTLPNVVCETCTLQVVQVMYDKQAGGWGDDDLYFQCADIAIRGPLLMDGTALDMPADATVATDTGSDDVSDPMDTAGRPADTGRSDAAKDTVADTADDTTDDTAGSDVLVVERTSDDAEDCACSGVRGAGEGTAPGGAPLGVLIVGSALWAVNRRRRHA